MRAWTKQQIFASVALFVFLVIRAPIGDIATNFVKLLSVTSHPSWLTNLVALQGWTSYFWADWSFILAGVVIIVNRSDLQSLNIDQYFLAIFIWAGLAYCWSAVWPSGWIAAIMSGYVVILYRNKMFKFGSVVPDMWRIILILGIIFISSLIFFFIRTSFDYKNLLSIIRHWLVTQISFMVVEELMFRGLLWKCLKDLNRSLLEIVILQAVLFWLFHAYYMFTSPYDFWIIIPIVSVILGITVWRSKSIFPSTLAHVLYNLL